MNKRCILTPNLPRTWPRQQGAGNCLGRSGREAMTSPHTALQGACRCCMNLTLHSFALCLWCGRGSCSFKLLPCCGMFSVPWKVRRPLLRVGLLSVAWKGKVNRANLNQDLRRARLGCREVCFDDLFSNEAFTHMVVPSASFIIKGAFKLDLYSGNS